jgi:hypothetical protein
VLALDRKLVIAAVVVAVALTPERIEQGRGMAVRSRECG